MHAQNYVKIFSFNSFFELLIILDCLHMFIFKILNKTVSLERMGTAQIMFRLTIPFVPLTVDVNGQQYKHDLSVQVSFPGDPAIEQECKLQGSALDCERKIESFTYDKRLQYDDPGNWQKVYTITVQNSDGIRYYMPTNHFRLRLKTTATNGQGDKIFSEVTLHDIRVSKKIIILQTFNYVFQFIYAIQRQV